MRHPTVATIPAMLTLLASLGWAKPSAPLVSKARLKAYRSTYVALTKQASPWIRQQLKGLPSSIRNAPQRMLRSTDRLTMRLRSRSPRGLRSEDSRARSRLGCSRNVASSADGKQSLSVSVSSGPLGGSALPEHSFGLTVQLQHQAANGRARISDHTNFSLATKLKSGQVSMLPQQVATVALSKSRTHKSGLNRSLERVAVRQPDGSWLVRTDYYRSQPNTQSSTRAATSYSRFTPQGKRERLTPTQGQQLWDAQ